METSVIIRTKNEEKWIGKVLEMLERQTYRDFEIIIVDSGSTDRTLDIAEKHTDRIIRIPPEEFSYPHALNVGCKAARAEKYFLFLSAHSLPVSEDFIRIGVEDMKEDVVMGTYGPINALPDASISEKFYFDIIGPTLDFFTKEKIRFSMARMGVLGFTNALIRKDLWERQPFDEDYGMGGEDQQWMDHWAKRGFVALKDKRFKVRHSHGLRLFAFIRQWVHWAQVSKPLPFSKSPFRN
ncbi:MAG TPA: glycosyltransferase family A protein [Candidatus Fimivivens sp.]|nr:glycosyltransferase family A protein [Candidatus Fimivivens sp.]